jgi:hypothetical protein
MIRVLKAGSILTIAEAGGIVWWLKYDVLPKLLKEERLEDIQIKRRLFNQVVVVKKATRHVVNAKAKNFLDMLTSYFYPRL